MTQQFDHSGSTCSSAVADANLASLLYSRNWLASQAPTEPDPCSSVSLSKSLNGRGSRKRSLSPSLTTQSAQKKSTLHLQTRADSASNYLSLLDSVSNAPPTPTETAEPPTSSTADSAPDISQELALRQSRLRDNLTLKQLQRSLHEQRAAAQRRHARASGMLLAQDEIDAQNALMTKKRRQEAAAANSFSTMPTSETETSSSSSSNNSKTPTPLELYHMQARWLPRIDMPSSAPSAPPTAPLTPSSELFTGPWNTTLDDIATRVEKDIARALRRQHRLNERRFCMHRENGTTRFDRMFEFAATLDVRASRLAALGLTVAAAVQAVPLYARKRKMPRSPCDRAGCTNTTRTISGVCKAHPCVVRGCERAQSVLGFCRKHENAYYYCTRIKQ